MTLAERIARVDAEIHAERLARDTDICRCGHTRGDHEDDVGCCRAGGPLHCVSFTSSQAALDVLRKANLL